MNFRNLVLFVTLLFPALSVIGSETLLVAVNQSVVFADPVENAYKAMLLNAGDRVRVISQKDMRSVPRQWIQIEVESCYSAGCKKFFKGWMLRKSLGLKDHFQPVTTWLLQQQFTECAGDYCPHFSFSKSGTHTYSSKQYGIELNITSRHADHCSFKEIHKIVAGTIVCYGHGKAYRYGDLIWLRHFNIDTNEYLFITPAGVLCMEGGVECMNF